MLKKEKNILLLCLISFIGFNGFGQYSITGRIDVRKPKTIYLSLLKFDEENLISTEQILYTTKTDDNGNFAFTGQLLSEKDKLYRIHANLEEINGFQLVRDSLRNNYCNFIFSNSDTLHFKGTENNWFSQSSNSKNAELEWQKLRRFKQALLTNDFPITNKEAKLQVSNDFSTKLKAFSTDSLSHPLVKLLAFKDIVSNGFDLKEDYARNSKFYTDLLTDLKNYYSGSSYYLQYQDELSKINYLIIQQKYVRQKRLSYILGILVAGLLVLSFFLFQKMKKTQPNSPRMNIEAALLTDQEEKIAQLILQKKSNKEIANELFISLNTVKTHIRNLYAKLNITKRQELSEKFKNHPAG